MDIQQINYRKFVVRIQYFVGAKIRGFFGQSHATREMPYDKYLLLQREKTEDTERRKLWLGPEYESKVTSFKKHFMEIFPMLINRDESVLCVGARTGQEVAALKILGYKNSIGVDLVPCPPDVIFGDMHNLPFVSDSYSAVFSNSFDHSIYPLKFLEEIHRVLVPGGFLILHLIFNKPNDKFGITDVYSPRAVKKLFGDFSIIQEGRIELFSLNYEFILKKV